MDFYLFIRQIFILLESTYFSFNKISQILRSAHENKYTV